MSGFRAPHKEVTKVARYAIEHGFEVRHTKNHIKMKKYSKTIIMAGSPSCMHGPSNALKDIQKLLTANGEAL